MFFKKDNESKDTENLEKKEQDFDKEKEKKLAVYEKEKKSKVAEETEKIDLEKTSLTENVSIENVQVKNSEVANIELTSDAKKENINLHRVSVTGKEFCKNMDISDEEKILLYNLIFKFGFLSHEQIFKKFSNKTAKEITQKSKLDKHEIAKSVLFFHNVETIKELALLSSDNVKELKKETLFWKQIKEENKLNLQNAIEEINILLAFNDACAKNSNYQFYDWISTNNPRRYRKSMNIKRIDLRRGSLSPNGTITIAKKSQRLCLILNLLPPFSAYLIGERRDKYSGIVNAFSLWLSDTEKVAKWIRKMKLYVATEELAVALIFPKESEDVIGDLTKKMADEEIHTPIYLTSYDELLKKPLSCWSININKHFFKTKKT